MPLSVYERKWVFSSSGVLQAKQKDRELKSGKTATGPKLKENCDYKNESMSAREVMYQGIIFLFFLFRLLNTASCRTTEHKTQKTYYQVMSCGREMLSVC